MLDKRTLPLVILLVAIILLWFPMLQWLGLYEPSSPQSDREQAQPTEQTQQPPVDTVQQPPRETAPPPDTGLAQVPDTATPGGAATDTLPIDTVVVKTNKYTIMLTNDGGGPKSLYLRQYHYRDTRDIQMLPSANRATPDARFAGGTFSTSRLRYESSKRPGEYDATRSEFDIEYRYPHPEGGEIVKRYRFYPDEYHFDLVLKVNDPSALGFERSYQMMWNTSLGVTEPQPETDYDAMEAVAMMSGSRETLDEFDNGRLKQTLPGYTDWAGVRSKYFASVLIPRGRQGDAAIAQGTKREIRTADGDEIEKKEITAGLEMPFANVAAFSDSFSVFVGPLDYSLMSDYDIGLEDILGIGTTWGIGWLIKPFAIAVIWVLPKMYSVIPNYGLVIILFALLVKVITMPLSMKSFKSMQAMKDLQPKMEELKKKHKKDPQALQKETMALYKKHGVNPLSGCLPILPQMPLFVALFRVFQSTILLRNAPFVGFINDLSRGASGPTDPYIILVLIMIGAQFISQRLTMASTQQNKALMYAMPLLMGFLFYRFPAGLILYWTCFSAFSLLDYFAFKRDKSGAEEAKSAEDIELTEEVRAPEANKDTSKAPAKSKGSRSSRKSKKRSKSK